jgi:DNA-binding MarR family transcriptional regulator
VPGRGHGKQYLGTHSDNMRDRRLAGHYESRKGQANNAAKLTDADVLELRRLYDEEGWIQQDLADRYGIAQPHVSAIVRRRSWTHLS